MPPNSPTRVLFSGTFLKFPMHLPVQWWMQKRGRCNTAHDWVHSKRRNLQKTPSWELILYHSLLLLRHECCCDSFLALSALLVFVACSEADANWLLSSSSLSLFFKVNFYFTNISQHIDYYLYITFISAQGKKKRCYTTRSHKILFCNHCFIITAVSSFNV